MPQKRRSKLVTVASLPYRDASDSEQRNVFLYCRGCRQKYSAVQEDYFNLDPGYVFVCCDGPMILAREVKAIEEV